MFPYCVAGQVNRAIGGSQQEYHLIRDKQPIVDLVDTSTYCIAGQVNHAIGGSQQEYHLSLLETSNRLLKVSLVLFQVE